MKIACFYRKCPKSWRSQLWWTPGMNIIREGCYQFIVSFYVVIKLNPSICSILFNWFCLLYFCFTSPQWNSLFNTLIIPYFTILLKAFAIFFKIPSINYNILQNSIIFVHRGFRFIIKFYRDLCLSHHGNCLLYSRDDEWSC